jgi:hypothetical protein
VGLSEASSFMGNSAFLPRRGQGWVQALINLSLSNASSQMRRNDFVYHFHELPFRVSMNAGTS